MPTPNAPPPEEAVGRFRRDFEALTGAGGACPNGILFGIAVSGGPDSLALLRLAQAALPGRIVAATVDHGLRTESAEEARDVGRICETLAIPHHILGPEPLAAGNMQEQARVLRYRLLDRWARAQRIACVATAHHRDDVAESFLMRALRGSGVGGLARMAAAAPMPHGSGDVRLIRPLLDWDRATLAAIAGDAIDDPSNRDPRFDRARIRALLAREPTLAAEPLARAAANLADAEVALDWIATQAWRSRATVLPALIRIDPQNLPREIARRLAARAICELAPNWTGEGLDTMVSALHEAQGRTLAGVQAAVDGGLWQFRIAPPRRRDR